MWDSIHVKQALAEGWRLQTTFDNGSTHPYWDVVAADKSFSSNHVALAAVIEKALRGGKLHQLALKLVVTSRARKSPNGRSKKQT